MRESAGGVAFFGIVAVLVYRLADVPKAVGIVGAGLLFLAAGMAIFGGRSSDDDVPAAVPDTPAAPTAFTPVPVPGSAASVVLDPGGGCVRARTATAQATAAAGMPGSLVLVRADARADGDVEMYLAPTGIDAGRAVALVRDHLLAAWGASTIRSVGESRDGLFQVTVG